MKGNQMNDLLKVVIENAAGLTDEEFTMIRRNGFGASDSGVLMGVLPKKFQTISGLKICKRLM